MFDDEAVARVEWVYVVSNTLSLTVDVIVLAGTQLLEYLGPLGVTGLTAYFVRRSQQYATFPLTLTCSPGPLRRRQDQSR